MEGRQGREGSRQGMEWLLCPAVMEGSCGGKSLGDKGENWGSEVPCLSLLVVCLATQPSPVWAAWEKQSLC